MSPAREANCPSRKELLAYSVGKLPDAALATIAAHLDTCGDCLSALSAIQDSGDSLVRGLRLSLSGEQFVNEPECQQAVVQFEAIGGAAPVSTQPNDAPPPIPRVFGRYQVQEEIGRGGMGTVYLAHDTQLDRQVALKVPRFRPGDSPQLIDRFYREARAAATVHHPNLCPIYDVGDIDGIPYLSMAFIRGQSLATLIRSGRDVSEREAAVIVSQLAGAIEEAHRRGIVHRDIKPSNVMLTDTWQPILTDFGLARRLESGDARLTHTGLIVGTPTYMAPEQVDGGPDTIGPSCDIYSLGVMLYELLAKRVPYEGPLLSVLSQIGNSQPVPPSVHRPNLDRRLETICLKAIAKRSTDRYSTAADLAAELDGWLTGSTTPSHTQGTTLPRPSIQRRVVWMVAASVCTLLGVCTFLLLPYFRDGMPGKTSQETETAPKTLPERHAAESAQPRDPKNRARAEHEIADPAVVRPLLEEDVRSMVKEELGKSRDGDTHSFRKEAYERAKRMTDWSGPAGP